MVPRAAAGVARPLLRYPLGPVHGLFPPVVFVHGSGRGHDADAAGLEAALGDVARGRGLVLAVLGRGPGPGLAPRSSTLRACIRSIRDREIPMRGRLLGRVGAEVVATLANERVAVVDDRDPLVCRWPDLDRTVTIPRGWIGRHLCLVVPCVGATAPRRGPIAAALAALGDAIGVRDVETPCEITARVVAGTFAGVTVVVDADVAVARARAGGGRPRLVPAHRMFTAHRVPAPASWLLALATGFDGWLARRTPSSNLRFAGPLADSPWSAAGSEPLVAKGPLWDPAPTRRRAGAPAGPRPR